MILINLVTVILVGSLFGGGAVQAQNTYDVLFDLDRNSASGCAVTPTGNSALSGYERRLRATVDSDSLQVTGVELQTCDGSAFQPLSPSGGPHPVGLNVGIDGGDVVELAVTRNALGSGNSPIVQLAFVANADAGSDVLATGDGTAGGNSILLGLPFKVPTLSLSGLLALGLIVLLLAFLAHRRFGRLGLLSTALLVPILVWAANFAADGDVGDWTDASPNAHDANNDATDGSSAIELLAAFASLEHEMLFFRMDVADLQNQAPVAGADAYSTDEDTALNEAAPGVLGNDSDADLDPITAVLDTGPSDAQSFALNPDGSFNYTPSADFNGADSFTYIANDGSSDSAPATVTITVNPINDPPTATADSATLLEDEPTDIDVLANDSDIDGNLDPASVNVTAGPANGGTSVNLADGVITYTKSGDFNGLDSFTYEVCDDGTPTPPECMTATVDVTVSPVNDAPGFTPGGDVTVDEDAGLVDQAWATGISAGPADEAGQVLTFNVTANDNAALFAVGPAIDSASGNLTFTPAANLNGSANIIVTLSDDGGTADGGVDTSPPASFAINVTAQPDPPTAVNDMAATDEDMSTSVDVTANDLDPDGDPLTVIATGGTPLGLVSINGNNVDYDPNGQFESLPAGAMDTDTFTYTIQDTLGAMSAAVVTVTVTGVNDDPEMTLPSAPASYVEGAEPRIIDPLATLADVDSVDLDGGTLTVILTNNATISDRLAINSEVPPNPSGTGLEISGSDILYNGLQVGTFSGGTDGSTPLVVNFTTAAATPVVAQIILRNLTFEDQAMPATFATRTVSADLTDGDGGTAATVTQTIEVVPPIICDGTVFSNFCWWLGDNGESCDTVCTDKGGNNSLGTIDFAGSGGNDANCGDVMTALNLDTGNPPSPTPVSNQAGVLGCASDFSGSAFTIRFIGPTDPAATGVNIRRACACNDQPAPISIMYPGAPYSLPRGIEISNIVPDVNGFVNSYEISPALPAGLNFDTATGVISGTPTVSSAATSYTVTAANAGGMVMDTFMLEVVPQPPADLDYPAAPFLFNLNNMVTPQLPTFTGQVDTFGISPPLPAGLTFNSATGEISGTPTVTQAAMNHTVTATNVDGMDTVTVSVEVTSMIACDGTAFAGFCWHLGGNTQSCDTVCTGRGGNNPDGTTNFAGSGGNDTNCGEVMTALNVDTGLPFNPTPVVNQGGALGCASDFTSIAFTIRFTGPTSASATGSNIRRACACNDQPAPTGLSYPNAPFTFTEGIPIMAQTPNVTNVVANWSISPSLPAGLTFNTMTGEISGNPTALQPPTNHTVTASNAGGSDMVVISLEVQAQPPMNLDYPGAPFIFNVGTPINPAQLPTVTGAVDMYSISPALPAGIAFNTSTGAISGTPTTPATANNHTVTATNSAGSDAVMISVTVNGAVTCDAGAAVVGGNCWYFGANNQSCDDVCSTHGGYNSATESFAGSGGSDGNCVAVLDALGQTQPGCTGTVNRTGLAVGCGMDFETADSCPAVSSTRNYIRYTSPATNGSASSASVSLFIRRACACNN